MADLVVEQQKRPLTAKEMAHEEFKWKAGAWREVGKWAGRAVCIAVSWLPLSVLAAICHEISGKTTRIEVTFVVSVSIVLGGTAFAFWLKTKSQKAELVRLRARTQFLEDQLKQEKATIVQLATGAKR